MRIITDTHLALSRKAHTTLESRARLARSLEAQMLGACETAPGAILHAGDLFDRHSNSERDILRVANIAAYCDYILAGNHDLVNDEDAVGSLDILTELLEDCTVVKAEKLDKSFFSVQDIEGMQIGLIPHHATQELFNTAVDSIVHSVKSGNRKKLRAVFLHCNYENKMAGSHDTSLNLTQWQAEALLGVSDYVFLGHEHQPRELLGGRLVILGNLHPTSFGDISDKFYYDLTPDNLTKVKCWDAGTGYLEVKFDGDPAMPIKNENASFISVSGKVPMDKSTALAEFLTRCWEGTEALMVRNAVTVESAHSRSTESMDIERLDQSIAEDLKDTEMEPLWDKYWGQVK